METRLVERDAAAVAEAHNELADAAPTGDTETLVRPVQDDGSDGQGVRWHGSDVSPRNEDTPGVGRAR